MAMATLNYGGKSKRIQLMGKLVKDPVLEELEITENGEYTPSEGFDGFSKVIAEVAASSGSSGMECGEITRTYSSTMLSIPTETKHTHVIVYPKNMDEIITTAGNGDVKMLFAVDGEGLVEVSLKNVSGLRNTGSSYWYAVGGDGRATFSETGINFTISYANMGSGDYAWYAW